MKNTKLVQNSQRLMDQVVSLADVFLDVTQRCVTSKKRLRGRLWIKKIATKKKTKQNKTKTNQTKKPYPLKILALILRGTDIENNLAFFFLLSVFH